MTKIAGKLRTVIKMTLNKVFSLRIQQHYPLYIASISEKDYLHSTQSLAASFGEIVC